MKEVTRSQQDLTEAQSSVSGLTTTESAANSTDPKPSSTNSVSPTPLKWLTGGWGLLVGVVIGIILTSVGNRLLSPKQVNSTIEATPVVASQPTAKSVTIATVATESIPRTLEATGSVAAFEMIPVRSQATGLQIKEVLVDEGEWVKVEQPIVRLDNSVLQAELARARADLAQAEARLAELRAGTRTEEIAQARERVRSATADVEEARSDLDLARKRVERNRGLEAEGAIARDRLDEVLNEERTQRANLQAFQARLQERKQELAQLQAGARQEVISQAEAQLARARGDVQLVNARLRDTQVVAPVSGKIASRNARVGDVTSSSQELFEIIENGRLELRLRIPETDLNQISTGQTVQITSQADRNLQLSGQVREIDPVIEENSRQAIVKVDLPGNSLQPGMFLKAAVTTSSDIGLTIPAKAVLPQSNGGAVVYTVVNGETVQAQTVDMGRLLPGGKVEIKGGLNPGEPIVVKGAAYLKDGDRVAISNEELMISDQ